jgi:hypothetical protein
MEMPLGLVCGILYVRDYATRVCQPAGFDAPIFVFVNAFDADM